MIDVKVNFLVDKEHLVWAAYAVIRKGEPLQKKNILAELRYRLMDVGCGDYFFEVGWEFRHEDYAGTYNQNDLKRAENAVKTYWPMLQVLRFQSHL